MQEKNSESEVETEQTITKHKKSKIAKKIMNEITADEKYINNEMFSNNFKYQNPQC